MLHINNHKSRKNPEIGRTMWLMPIRYWEPGEYEPQKFEVKEVSENGSLYGYSYEYGHNVYISVDSDFIWFYSKKECRRAQRYLAGLHTVISRDEMTPIMEKVHEYANNKKNP